MGQSQFTRVCVAKITPIPISVVCSPSRQVQCGTRAEWKLSSSSRCRYISRAMWGSLHCCCPCLHLFSWIKIGFQSLGLSNHRFALAHEKLKWKTKTHMWGLVTVTECSFSPHTIRNQVTRVKGSENTACGPELSRRDQSAMQLAQKHFIKGIVDCKEIFPNVRHKQCCFLCL